VRRIHTDRFLEDCPTEHRIRSGQWVSVRPKQVHERVLPLDKAFPDTKLMHVELRFQRTVITYPYLLEVCRETTDWGSYWGRGRFRAPSHQWRLGLSHLVQPLRGRDCGRHDRDCYSLRVRLTSLTDRPV
jgi:hypothetical protein